MMPDIKIGKPVTERDIRRIRRYVAQERDRDNLEDLVESMRAAFFHKADLEKEIDETVPTHVRDMFQAAIYDCATRLNSMPMERLPHLASIEKLDDFQISKRLEQLRKDGMLSPEQHCEMSYLQEEFQIRKFNKGLEKRLADQQRAIEAEQQRINSDEYQQAQQDYERLNGIDTSFMSIENHKQHWQQLMAAAHETGVDDSMIMQLKERMIVSGSAIVEYETSVYEADKRRDPFNDKLERPDYNVYVEAQKLLTPTATPDQVERQKYHDAVNAHLDKKRADYNSRPADDKRDFDEKAIRTQFAFDCEQAQKPGDSPRTRIQC